MPRRSTKENKTAYQLSRERAGLTREAAAERMEFISAARIEKIENERSELHPEEVLAMAEAYGDRRLIAPGIVCAITGLVLGNLLGIGVGGLLAAVL